MSEPTAVLTVLRSSTANLLVELDEARFGDADLARPSRCEGWTRAHVLTHLARNADGIAGTVSGALRGELVPQYPGGDDSRDREIEEGTHRPAAAILADVREAAERLDRVFGAVADVDGWALLTAQDVPVGDWLLRRLREVEVHRTDLDTGYSPEQWPATLVESILAAESAESTEAGGRADAAAPSGPVDEPQWALAARRIGRR